MRMSDLVTQYILELLESSGGSAEIQRNELAGELGCVPSQINYVITSRFTPEQGYLVESRRGGGGYIRIMRMKLDRSSALMHLINSIGSRLDAAAAERQFELGRGPGPRDGGLRAAPRQGTVPHQRGEARRAYGQSGGRLFCRYFD